MAINEAEGVRGGRYQDQIELQDLGDGHWRAVCGDRSIDLDELDGDISTTLGRLAPFAGYVGAYGPADLARVLKTAVEDGLIDRSQVVGPGPTWKSDIPCKDWRLTRKACLLLMTRCNKPRCIEFTRKMADVFERWLDRRPHSTGIDPRAFETLANAIVKIQEHQGQLAAAIVQIADRMTALEERVASQDSRHGLISRERRREILDELQFFADCFYNRKTHRKEWNSKRSFYEKELRKVAMLTIGAGWGELPSSRDALVENKLLEIRKSIPAEVQKQRRAEYEAAKQMPLHGVN